MNSPGILGGPLVVVDSDNVSARVPPTLLILRNVDGAVKECMIKHD